MSKQNIAEFEAAIRKVCENYREKLTHAEWCGTLDNVKVGYQIRTIQSFEETEMCETPVIKDEQANAPIEGEHILDEIARKEGSPVPAEVADG